jgi:hypothetical protein
MVVVYSKLIPHDEIFEQVERLLALPQYANQEPTRLREMRKILQSRLLEPENFSASILALKF